MNFPAQILLVSQLCFMDAGVTFTITPDQQKQIDFLRKFDQVWVVDYPYIKMFTNRDFRIVQVFNSSDLNVATESRFFYFEMSNPNLAPTSIAPNSMEISGADLLYGGSRFQLSFQFAIPHKQ